MIIITYILKYDVKHKINHEDGQSDKKRQVFKYDVVVKGSQIEAKG